MVYNDAASSRCSSAPRARRPANEIVDEAVAWLSRHDVEPFFVWIHLYDTHRPYRLPAEYANRYADPYLDAIAFEDSQISRVISYLEQRRLLDDTLVVIAGDHGESLGDHGEQSHGIFIYQEALHVPLVLRGPGIPPVRVSGVRRLVDVMPTVLDHFGATVPGLDGVSLSGDFRGSGPQQLDVYAESLYPQRFGWASLRSLRTDRFKVIEAPRPELYDLAMDPGEQRNIFEENRAIGAAMLERLRAFSGPGNPTLDPAPLIDRHVAARISSLGYIGGTTEPAAMPAGSQPDPKDKIETFNWMTSLQAQNASRFRAIRQGCGSAGRP
jgi:arylsulfatase A-like enzyme